MGVWYPVIHHFSSNWKEVTTLQLTLERETRRPTPRCKDSVLFYFTDNLVTYHIVTKGSAKEETLQAVVQTIKLLEIILCCQLVVIHIPGDLMIVQGTDALSRGMWLTSLQHLPAGPQLLSAIFSAATGFPGWVPWILTSFSLPMTAVVERSWEEPWTADRVHGQFTAWLPPPEAAAQVLSLYLKLWLEHPLTTSALFVIPRVLTRDWQFLSQYVITLGEVQPQSTPCLQHTLPMVVLYIPTHVRTLPITRMDGDLFSYDAATVYEATLLRGMS